MGFLKDIEKQGIRRAIEIYSPSVLVTNHLLDIPKKSYIRIFLGTMAIFLLSLLESFKRPKRVSTKYNTLIYVPNEKYTRFFSALVSDAPYSYLVLSDSKLSVDSITLHDFATFSRGGYFFLLIKRFFILLKISIVRKECNLFFYYYWIIISILRRELLLECMLKRVSFKNYLSFQPIDSYHSIIQTIYKHLFVKTLAIRPTTTSYSEENRFYESDILFYKSIDEKEIYEQMCRPNILLEEGGLLYPLFSIPSAKKLNNKCICFDTCTSKDERWNDSRLVFLDAFLKYAKKNRIYVYYKFHPGLLACLRRDMEKCLAMYDNVEIVKNDIPWNVVDFSIGFSSTIFFDSILRKVPVFDIGTKTYFFDEELQKYCINRLEDLDVITNFYKNKDVITEEQFMWLCRKYNYPDGMSRINRMLLV